MKTERTSNTTERIREGNYVAEVEITLHYGTTEWDPTIEREDVEKLDRVRRALRGGDLKAAAREAKIFELHPVAAE